MCPYTVKPHPAACSLWKLLSQSGINSWKLPLTQTSLGGSKKAEAKKQFRSLRCIKRRHAVKASLFWFVFHATHTCKHTPIISILHVYHCIHWQFENLFLKSQQGYETITNEFNNNSRLSQCFTQLLLNTQARTEQLKYWVHPAPRSQGLN